MNNGDDLQIGGNSVISLEGLTKPATVLIEKVSDAVGTLYRPRQIVREARAQAEADKIKAIAGMEISDLQRRGIVRFVEQQGRWQENFESIVAQALPELTEDAKPEEIENDWLTRFFESSKLISDKEMQTLWARLLAGEANEAGTFTKRTIEQVSNLEKSDAELFTRLCGCCFLTDKYYPLVNDLAHPIYKEKDLNFDAMQHLDSIGLINFDMSAQFALVDLQAPLLLNYFGTVFGFDFPNERNEGSLVIGTAFLTKIGQELAPISGAVGSSQFLEYALIAWRDQGYASYSPMPYGQRKTIP